MKFAIAAVALLAFSMPSLADPSSSTVRKVVDSLNAVFDDHGECSALDGSRTIMCVVNTSPGEADKFARGIVFTVNSQNIDMSRWKVTVVTFDDYVVSLRF